MFQLGHLPMMTFHNNHQNSFRFCFLSLIFQYSRGLKSNSPKLYKKMLNQWSKITSSYMLYWKTTSKNQRQLVKNVSRSQNFCLLASILMLIQVSEFNLLIMPVCKWCCFIRARQKCHLRSSGTCRFSLRASNFLIHLLNGQGSKQVIL